MPTISEINKEVSGANSSNSTSLESSIVSKDDKYIEYHYTIEELILMIKEEHEDLPKERIVDFKICHYFEEATFPIFKLRLMMEPSRYYSIVKNRKDVKFKVRMQTYYTPVDSVKQSLVKDVISDTFSLFLEDDNSDYQKDLKEEAGTSNDINKLDKIGNIVEFFLFKDSFVGSLRGSFNAVLSNVNMATAVTFLLSKAGVTNVLMSPFENTKTYGNVVLPPQSIDKQIRYLNNNYGFYKEGGVVYFGLFHSYILNCKAGCTAWAKDEWKETNICILEKSNTKSTISSVIDKIKEKKYYYNASAESVSINSSTMTFDVLQGANATVIDTAGGSTNISAKAETKNDNSNVIYNNSSNIYAGTTYAAQQHSNSTIVSLILKRVELEAFNPNKTFSLIFENAKLNKKYKGLYRIASAIYTFERNGDYFDVDAAIVLKKVN